MQKILRPEWQGSEHRQEVMAVVRSWLVGSLMVDYKILNKHKGSALQ